MVEHVHTCLEVPGLEDSRRGALGKTLRKAQIDHSWMSLPLSHVLQVRDLIRPSRSKQHITAVQCSRRSFDPHVQRMSYSAGPRLRIPDHQHRDLILASSLGHGHAPSDPDKTLAAGPPDRPTGRTMAGCIQNVLIRLASRAGAAMGGCSG